MYAIGHNTDGPYTVRCNIRFTSTGTIGGGVCRLADGTQIDPAANGSSAHLGTDCLLSAVDIPNAGDRILQGRMSRDKESISGVGRDTTGGVFHFNAHKK